MLFLIVHFFGVDKRTIRIQEPGFCGLKSDSNFHGRCGDMRLKRTELWYALFGGSLKHSINCLHARILLISLILSNSFSSCFASQSANDSPYFSKVDENDLSNLLIDFKGHVFPVYELPTVKSHLCELLQDNLNVVLANYVGKDVMKSKKCCNWDVFQAMLNNQIILRRKELFSGFLLFFQEYFSTDFSEAEVFDFIVTLFSSHLIFRTVEFINAFGSFNFERIDFYNTERLIANYLYDSLATFLIKTHGNFNVFTLLDACMSNLKIYALSVSIFEDIFERVVRVGLESAMSSFNWDPETFLFCFLERNLKFMSISCSDWQIFLLDLYENHNGR